MHARKHNLPIDSLKIDFEILNPTIFQRDIYEQHLRNTEEVCYNPQLPLKTIFNPNLFLES